MYDYILPPPKYAFLLYDCLYLYSVYAAAIDCILLSYCEDRKINKNANAYFMSKELQHYIHRNAIKDHAHDKGDAQYHLAADGESDENNSGNNQGRSPSTRKLTIDGAQSVGENPLAVHHHPHAVSSPMHAGNNPTSMGSANDSSNNHNKRGLVPADSVAHMSMAQAEI